MDYSLLLVIENKSRRNDLNTSVGDDDIEQKDCMQQKHEFVSGNRIYHVAIIDYLQEWNLNKMSERLMKTVILMKDGEQLSAIEPEQYGRRF